MLASLLNYCDNIFFFLCFNDAEDVLVMPRHQNNEYFKKEKDRSKSVYMHKKDMYRVYRNVLHDFREAHAQMNVVIS